MPFGFLSTREIADYLSLTILTIRRWIYRGKLKAIKNGHDWLIKRNDFRSLLKSFKGGEENEQPNN